MSLSIILCGMMQFQFVAREADTRVYSRFVKQLAKRPFYEIIAPRWTWYSPYKDPENPLVRDHLPGQFLLPVLLVKAGFPEDYGLYFSNLIFRLASLYLIFLIAQFYLPPGSAAYIPILLQLIVMNITYQLRANQEHPLLFFALLGLWGVLKFLAKNVRPKNRYLVLASFSLVAAFFIKGLAFIPLFIAYFAALFLNVDVSKRKNIVLWATISFFGILFFAYLFELSFEKVTSYSFFSRYFSLQIVERSIQYGANENRVLSAIKSFSYYFFRLFTYSAPISLAIIWVAIKRKGEGFKNFIKDPLVVSSLCYLLFFSLSKRVASRYLYPIYFIFSLRSLVTVLNYYRPRTLSSTTAAFICLGLFTALALINILTSVGNHLKYPY